MDTTCPAGSRGRKLERYHSLLVQRHLLRNYLAHAIEGGLYMGGMRFVAADTLGPVMVASLLGPEWLIAIMPITMMLGYVLPQMLIAHHIQGMTRHMPFVTLVGVFQRLPLLAAGLVLLLAGGHRVAALAAVVLAPLTSGLIAGLGVNAWQELVAKTIPAARRSSLFAARNVLMAIIGLGAGGTVATVLRWWPGTVGYGILHLVAFGFLAASLCVFLRIRETPYPHPPVRHAATLADNLRQMPRLVAADRRFRNFLLADALMAGIYIMMPFLGIHALAVLGKPDDYLGFLLMVQTVGAIGGNLLGAALGDRYGGKVTIVLGQAAYAAICLWGILASRSAEFLAIFGLLGAAQTWASIGKQTISLEISSIQQRASYLAIIGANQVPATLLAWTVSFVTWRLTHSFAAVALLSAGCVLLSATLMSRVREPRRESPPAPGGMPAFPVPPLRRSA